MPEENHHHVYHNHVSVLEASASVVEQSHASCGAEQPDGLCTKQVSKRGC